MYLKVSNMSNQKVKIPKIKLEVAEQISHEKIRSLENFKLWANSGHDTSFNTPRSKQKRRLKMEKEFKMNEIISAVGSMSRPSYPSYIFKCLNLRQLDQEARDRGQKPLITWQYRKKLNKVAHCSHTNVQKMLDIVMDEEITGESVSIYEEITVNEHMEAVKKCK